jgi:hypothetical protein
MRRHKDPVKCYPGIYVQIYQVVYFFTFKCMIYFVYIYFLGITVSRIRKKVSTTFTGVK